MYKKTGASVLLAFLSLIAPTVSRAQVWTNLGSGMNSAILSLAYDTNGQLYAAGWFTNAGGVAAKYIAKWDGTSWTNLGSGMNSVVYALASGANGQLYAGG